MKKKFVASALIVAFIFSGIIMVPEKAKAAEVSTSVYFDTNRTYKISDYWSVENKKVPLKDGYVFGGWYESGADNQYIPLKEENLTNDNIKEITAYAKFVPAEVLSVKTQLATENAGGSTKAFLRLLSTTDSANYQKVGFEYQLGAKKVADKEMTKIYSAIRPSKSSPDSDILYPRESFATASGYFIALDVNNISESSFASIVYARAYWITPDGTKVMGLARNNRVEDKQKDYISASVNLLTDGVSPLYIAAGKVTITYNTDDYDVVVCDNVYKVDTGKVFSEMNYAIDEKKGIISFVGNASIVDENMIADGLYANIRFVKTTSNADAALDFTIKTNGAEFCNWKEELATSKTLSVQ